MNFPITLTLPLRNKSIAAINHDIDDELEFHIQCRIDELIAGGVLPEQAEIQSRRPHALAHEEVDLVLHQRDQR